MSTIYFNIKTSEGVETVDELSLQNFNSYKDFRKAKNILLKEYREASNFYTGIYTSKRCTNEWKQQ